MVATIGKISAGAGYEYLSKAVATGSHDYYTGVGEAPGVWAGRGLDTLGLVDGEMVDEAQMEALFGLGLDWRTMPAAGSAPTQIPEALGRRFPAPTLNADGTVRSSAVAGYDVQFAPAKSVSALWAVADPEMRQRIEALHDAAIDDAFNYLERHAAYSRAGAGGVRQVDTVGLIAARFQHRTSRNGDPQLHTHCAVLNRVKCVDGSWRSLDARHLYAHAHTAGALYARSFEGALSAEFGAEWSDEVDNGRFREIVGVPDEVCHLWSSRRHELAAQYATLHESWWDTHGYEPTAAQRAKLFQQATLETRSAKEGVELHTRWRREIGDALVDEVLGAVGGTAPMQFDTREQWDQTRVSATVNGLSRERAVMNRAQIARGVLARMGTFPDAAEMLEDLVDEVTADPMMVELTRAIDPLDNTPGRDDGESLWRPANHGRFTTVAVLNAEQRLLDAAEQPGTTLERGVVDAAVDDLSAVAGRGLSPDQQAAVNLITNGGHRLATVIGPAGAGKTTTMRAAVAAWQRSGRRVIGLTLSQNAANVLSDEAGCDVRNLAQWRNMMEHQGTERFEAGDLIIVDEAAMVPTLTLDWLVRRADEADANVVFVGDYAQLPSPEAGGIVRDLAHSPAGVWLTGVHRFRNEWERDASLALRDMHPDTAAIYNAHGRIHGVTADEAQQEIVDAWWSDTRSGSDTVLLADTNEQAAELSAHAQTRLVAAGQVDHTKVVSLADQNRAGVGDLIQTRRNDHELRTSSGRAVANRDMWTITAIGDHGEVQVAGAAGHVTLPADYVSEHVTLGYSGTVHAVQGRTVDAAHVLVTPSTDHAGLYVAMTRGRWANTAHVITTGHDHEEFDTGVLEPMDAFTAAMNRDVNERSALSQVRDTYDGMRLDELYAISADVRLHGAEQLLDEYARSRGRADFEADDTLTRAIARRVGHADLQPVLESMNLGNGRDIDRQVLDEIARLPVTNDEPTVLVDHHRQTRRLGDAIEQRQTMIGEFWSTQPKPPRWSRPLVGNQWHPNPTRRDEQQHSVTQVAAYRERHHIETVDTPVTGEHAQRAEWKRFIARIQPARSGPQHDLGHRPDNGYGFDR